MSIKPQESRATWKTFRRCGSGQSAESSLDVWSGRHCCHARFYIESREFHHDWISRTRCRIDRDDSPGGLTLSKPTLQQQIATMIYISYRKMNRERLAAKLENWAESLGKMVDALCGKLNDYYLLLNGESEFSNDQNVNDLSMINTFLVCGPRAIESMIILPAVRAVKAVPLLGWAKALQGASTYSKPVNWFLIISLLDLPACCSLELQADRPRYSPPPFCTYGSLLNLI